MHTHVRIEWRPERSRWRTPKTGLTFAAWATPRMPAPASGVSNGRAYIKREYMPSAQRLTLARTVGAQGSVWLGCAHVRASTAARHASGSIFPQVCGGGAILLRTRARSKLRVCRRPTERRCSAFLGAGLRTQCPAGGGSSRRPWGQVRIRPSAEVDTMSGPVSSGRVWGSGVEVAGPAHRRDVDGSRKGGCRTRRILGSGAGPPHGPVRRL